MRILSFKNFRLISIIFYWLIMFLLCIVKKWSLIWIMIGILLILHIISMAFLQDLYTYILKKMYFNYFKRNFKLVRELYFFRYKTFFQCNNELTNKISKLLNISFSTIINTGNTYIELGIFNKKQVNKIKEMIRQTEIMLNNSSIIIYNKS